MTDLTKRKHVYVASEQYRDALDFCLANLVDPFDLVWLSERSHVYSTPIGLEIWVLGQIGRDLAEELHFRQAYRGAQIKYADKCDKVRLTYA